MAACTLPIPRKLRSEVDSCLLPHPTFTVSSPYQPVPTQHLHHFFTETAFSQVTNEFHAVKPSECYPFFSGLTHRMTLFFHSDCIFLERSSLMTQAEIVPPFPHNGVITSLCFIVFIAFIFWICHVHLFVHLLTMHLMSLPRTLPGTSQMLNEYLLSDRHNAVFRIFSSLQQLSYC